MREIKEKIHKLNIETKALRVNANTVNYKQAIVLRQVKDENEKKIAFYKNLLNAVRKEKTR